MQTLIGDTATRAATTGHPGPPLLVEHLDRTGVGYYLVPWNLDSETALVVRIDASTGAFLGLVEFSLPSADPFFSSDAALDRVKVEMPGADFEAPRCVWRPCRETTTPFRPLFEFACEDGLLYVDMDGVVHRALTPLGRGG